MKAMILAAGYGTRLRPVTYTLPKPMVPLCNRPLIAYAVEVLKNAGVDELVVNLHHLPAPIEKYLHDTYASDIEIHFSFEPEILGTGGGVRKVRPLLERDADFFLVNADTIQFPDWQSLRRTRAERDALAALTLRHPPAGDKFTAVYLENGLITGFGTGRGEALMFSGSHCISSRIFRYLPEKDFSGIVDEAYGPTIASGREKVAGFVDDGLWFDIGSPQRYLSAAQGMLEAMTSGRVAVPARSVVRGTSLIHDTAHAKKTIERSTVGARSVVEGDVRDSFIWDDCRVAAGSTLERCIVAHGVHIVDKIDLRDSLIVATEHDGLSVVPI
jgi:mannose-1-phosphate guanylyltransferase